MGRTPYRKKSKANAPKSPWPPSSSWHPGQQALLSGWPGAPANLPFLLRLLPGFQDHKNPLEASGIRIPP